MVDRIGRLETPKISRLAWCEKLEINCIFLRWSNWCL